MTTVPTKPGQAPAPGATAGVAKRGRPVGQRLVITGIVQGVGFRPFVHRLANELGLDGHVGNDSSGVFIAVTGPAGTVDRFVDRLQAEAPPLAHIEQLTRTPAAIEVSGSGFHIVESRQQTGARTLIPPDSAVCEDCRRELFDPADRRHHHPFITCTNCGPRFTIITDLPYDRPNTTMARFDLCHRCHTEYNDPTDRRHHAQPIGCHDCGPTLQARNSGRLDGNRSTLDGDPIDAAAAAITAGRIVAVKGVGGYHLVCDATDRQAVTDLRTRKHRPDKPFAVMVADLPTAGELAEISAPEAGLLASPSAPIVLLRARVTVPSLDPLVAPDNPLFGLMLPCTPVHHLVVERCRRPLVMTSLNRGGTPIAHTTAAADDLGDLYDLMLDHNRPIHVPCDDSVVRMVGDRLLPIRRARGYAPIPVAIPASETKVAEPSRPGTAVAVGGELKNTFCVSDGHHAWVSQHIGDLENLETVAAFERLLEGFQRMYDVDPQVVAADLHPGYLSTKWASDNHRDRLVGVQHHHAHIASVLAEHGVPPETEVIGFAFDGTGYGTDGTIWGGELLVATAGHAERVAHLAPIPLPGGDAAIQNPNRVALAHLFAAGIPWAPTLAPLAELSGVEQQLLTTQLERSVNCVPTTSMGRLFDAVASLAGIRHRISYEAQAAIELEIAAARHQTREDGYRFAVDGRVIGPGPVLEAMLEDLAAGLGPEAVAWRFHDAVAELITRLATEQRRWRGLDLVALSGGVFQNALLTELSVDRLESAGFTVLTHSLVPPNDGGLALGQAFIALNKPALQETQES